jgi:hypothetical protein
MLKKVLVLLYLVLAAALPLARPVAADGNPKIHIGYLANDGPLGELVGGASGLQIQNLDPVRAAHVTVELYHQDGSPPVLVDRPDVAAGSTTNLFLPAMPELKRGVYAAIIGADRPIAAVSRADFAAGGEAVMIGDAMIGNLVFVPLALKYVHGQVTAVVIQNPDPVRKATVTIDLHVPLNIGARVSTMREIGPGSSVTVDMGRDPAFADLAGSTVNSIVIKSPDIPVAAWGLVVVGCDGPAVYAYAGLPAGLAATRLYAPLIRNDFHGTTGIAVLNPGSDPVTVKVTYLGSPNTPICAGNRLHQGHGIVTLGGQETTIFYQANAFMAEQGDSGLPVGCLGSAVIESTGGPVLAVVNDGDRGRSSAAYNAFADADGARRVALPLYRKEHAGLLNLSTGIQVMNIGNAPARVALEIRDEDGKVQRIGPTGEVGIAPLGSHAWYPPAIAGLPGGVYGSAIVTSDQPTVVIVNDASGLGAMDAAMYRGVKGD